MPTNTVFSLTQLEKVVLSAAAVIRSKIATKHYHPSHGVTKTMIKADFHRMTGVIAAYGILTEQIVSLDSWASVDFPDSATTEYVRLTCTEFTAAMRLR